MDRTGGQQTDRGAGSQQPRALIHKKILTAAAESPNASMAAIAEEVSGASIDLVERVLEEYGDPADDDEPDDSGAVQAGSDQSNVPTTNETATASATSASPGQSESSDLGQLRADGATEGTSFDDATQTGDVSTTVEPGTGDAGDDGSDRESADEPATATGDGLPAPKELDERELDVLRVVAERPSATQGEVADELGVSRGTVSRRLSKVDGFEWNERDSFVERLFDHHAPAESRDLDAPAEGSNSGPDPEPGTDPEPDTDSEPEAASDSPDLSPTEQRAVDEALTAAITDLSHAVEDLAGDVDSLAGDVDSLDDRLDEATGDDVRRSEQSVLHDADLAHKVVHACIDAEYVTQDEELRILKAILGGS